jgi:hypothetical protein
MGPKAHCKRTVYEDIRLVKVQDINKLFGRMEIEIG